MGRLSVFLVGMLFALGTRPVFASPDSSGAEQHIRESEAAWDAATVVGDASAAQRLFADDYVGVWPDGSVLNKTQAIAEIGKKPSPFSSVHLDYVHVRVFGDTAVAQGQDTWTETNGERARLIWTDTWLRRKGSWQMVNSEDQLQPISK